MFLLNSCNVLVTDLKKKNWLVVWLEMFIINKLLNICLPHAVQMIEYKQAKQNMLLVILIQWESTQITQLKNVFAKKNERKIEEVKINSVEYNPIWFVHTQNGHLA